MSLEADDLSRLFSDPALRPPRDRSACLEPEALERARTGSLVRGERDRVVDHLASCPDCAAEVQLLREVAGLAARAAADLAPAAAAGVVIDMASARTRGRRGRSPWAAAGATAATAALAAVLLAVWALGLRQENRRLAGALDEARHQTSAARAAEQRAAEAAARWAVEAEARLAEATARLAARGEPRLNVAILDLEPTEVLRGGEEPAAQRLELPPGAELVTLILHLAGPPPEGPVDLEIIDVRGRVVWRGSGLRRTAYDTYQLAFEPGLLAPGRYRLRLLAPRRRGAVLQEYRVELTGGS